MTKFLDRLATVIVLSVVSSVVIWLLVRLYYYLASRSPTEQLGVALSVIFTAAVAWLYRKDLGF